MIKLFKIAVLKIVIESPGLTLHKIKKKIDTDYGFDRKMFGDDMKKAAHNLKWSIIKDDEKVLVMSSGRYYKNPKVSNNDVIAYAQTLLVSFESELRHIIDLVLMMLRSEIGNIPLDSHDLPHFQLGVMNRPFVELSNWVRNGDSEPIVTMYDSSDEDDNYDDENSDDEGHVDNMHLIPSPKTPSIACDGSDNESYLKNASNMDGKSVTPKSLSKTPCIPATSDDFSTSMQLFGEECSKQNQLNHNSEKSAVSQGKTKFVACVFLEKIVPYIKFIVDQIKTFFGMI